MISHKRLIEVSLAWPLSVPSGPREVHPLRPHLHPAHLVGTKAAGRHARRHPGFAASCARHRQGAEKAGGSHRDHCRLGPSQGRQLPKGAGGRRHRAGHLCLWPLQQNLSPGWLRGGRRCPAGPRPGHGFQVRPQPHPQWRSSRVGGVDPWTRYYILLRWAYSREKIAFDDVMRLAMTLGADVSALTKRCGLLQQPGETFQERPRCELARPLVAHR